jgi:hypothetical protein
MIYTLHTAVRTKIIRELQICMLPCTEERKKERKKGKKHLVSDSSATCCEDKTVHQQTLPAYPPCLFWLVRWSSMAD